MCQKLEQMLVSNEKREPLALARSTLEESKIFSSQVSTDNQQIMFFNPVEETESPDISMIAKTPT